MGPNGLAAAAEGCRRQIGWSWPAAHVVLSLVMTTIGSGILSLPYAAAQAGVAVILVTTIVLGGVSLYCSLIVAEFAYAHRAELKSNTFDELCGAVLGRRHYAVAAGQVVLGLLGACIGFLCVIGDLATPVLGAALGGRAGVIMVFATLLVLPLAGCSRIHALRGSSALGVAAVVAVVGLLCAQAVEHPSPTPPALAPTTASGFLLAFPCVLYSVGNQVVGCNIFLDAPAATQRAFLRPAAAAFSIIIGLYCIAAVAGACAFGANAQGDVLLNFPLTNNVASVFKCLMVVHVALVIPVDVVPLRRSAVFALRACRTRGSPSLVGDEEEVSSRSDAPLLGDNDVTPGVQPRGALGGPTEVGSAKGALNSDPQADGNGGAMGSASERQAFLAAEEASEAALPHICGTPCSPAIALQVAVAVYLPASFAILFPKINVLFGLLGATLGVTCLMTYPAFFLLAKAAAVDSELGGTGTVVRHAAAARGEDAPRYTPSSALCLRIHGWALIALSGVCIVLGTGVYVWTTWVSP